MTAVTIVCVIPEEKGNEGSLCKNRSPRPAAGRSDEVIDEALASAGPTTYQLQLIHGYNRGTCLRSMIHDWYQYEPKVKRIMPGDNPGITVLVLKELY